MNSKELKQRLQNLSINQKILSGVFVILVVTIFFLMGQWLLEVEYAPLMTNLEARDASAIVEKLKEQNIPYQLTNQGTTIAVPKDQVYEVRVELASTGIFEGGGLGFELFDQTKLGVTDFERRLNYQRALQEELRRTITQLDEVEAARVHIVLPEKSVFVEDEQEASASIALKLKPLAILKPNQVKGIVYLASSSVEGLPPERVNVIDMNGNILSEDVLSANSSDTHKTLSQQETQKKFEKELEKRVQTMLEKILGPGKAVAMVTAELDFDQQETTAITYEDNGVIRSEQITEETSSSVGGTQIPAGTGSNNSPDTYPVVTPGESESGRNEEVRNYEPNQTQSKIIKAPGSLKRLSTAVTVDGDLDPVLVGEIEDMVAAAIGYSQQRGDQILVSSMAFDSTYLEQTEAEMAKVAQAQAEALKNANYVKLGAGGIAALVAIIVAILLARSRGKRSVGAQLDKAINEPIAIRDIEKEAAVTEVHEGGGAFENHRQVKDMAAEKPDEVADLLKVWLAEDRG